MTNDPIKQDYTPAYTDPMLERDRLIRCLQQQVEDCFTTITRIQVSSRQAGQTGRWWDDVRGGLRVWRMALRYRPEGT